MSLVLKKSGFIVDGKFQEFFAARFVTCVYADCLKRYFNFQHCCKDAVHHFQDLCEFEEDDKI